MIGNLYKESEKNIVYGKWYMQFSLKQVENLLPFQENSFLSDFISLNNGLLKNKCSQISKIYQITHDKGKPNGSYISLVIQSAWWNKVART